MEWYQGKLIAYSLGNHHLMEQLGVCGPDLEARLEALVVALGQPPEPRPFRPHVTLARLKNLTRAQLQPYLARHGAFHLGPIEVPAFGLYASRTQPEGSVYTLEGRVPLGPPA